MASPYFLLQSRDKVYIFFGALIAIGESLSNPGATIVIGKFFTNIQKLTQGLLSSSEFSSKNQTLTYWLVGITGYTILLNFIGYSIWVSNGYKVGHAARLKMYKALVQQDSAIFDGENNLAGLALTHFKDIQDLEAATGIVSYEMIVSGAGCIAEIAVAFYYSWAVTLICLVGIPIIAAIGTFLSGPITKQINIAKTTLDGISERVSWVFGALQTVRLFQKEKFESMWCFKETSRLRRQNNKYWVLFQLQQGLCRAIVLMIFMQGFYFGSFMVKKHHLPAGNVISVFWCSLNASALFQTFMSHLVEWNRGKASSDRLSKVFHEDQEEELIRTIGLAPGFETEYRGKLEKLGWSFGSSGSPGQFEFSPASPVNPFSPTKEISIETSSVPSLQRPWTPKGEIKFTDVVFSYPQRDEIILAGLSLTIEPEKTTFILGESGSGKSTLASIMSKQYPYQAGEVTIDEHDVHLLSQNWIEENVYVCDQNTKLFDVSIRENVKIGSRSPDTVSEQQVEGAIDDACADFVWGLEDQLDYTGVSNLSGGQKQRLSIARARLNDAPIMIYDEITSALDSQLQTEVFSNLLRYRSGKTNIVITHDYTVIPLNQTVYVVKNGQAQRYNSISEITDIASIPDPTSNPPEFDSTPGDRFGDSEIAHFKTIEQTNANSSTTWEMFATSISLMKSIPSKTQLILGLTMTAIHAGINPAFSYCFSKLMMGILDPAAKRLTLWAMLIVLLAILDGLSTFLGVLLNLEAEKWLSTTRCKLFNSVVGDGPLIDHKQATYLSKLLLSDSEKCAEIITRYWPGLLSMFILGTVGFICALAFGWKLALVCMSLLPFFVAASSYYKRIAESWTGRRESLRAGVVRLMMDLTSDSGFRTIKAQHLERHFKSIYNDREGEMHKISPQMAVHLGAGYGFLRCFPYALECLILWYGMRLVAHNEYTVNRAMTVFSMLMFTIITMDQLTSSIGSVGVGFEALPRFLTAAKTSLAEQSLHPQITSEVDGKKPKWQNLTFFQISKCFNNRPTALKEFTQTIRQGETVSIMGPSGSGKSTLAKLLLCLEEPSAGEIVVDSKWDLSRISLWDVRQNIAMVNQAPLDFFAGTIEENLLYGLPPSDYNDTAKVVNACIKCGAHDFISRMKDQYDTKMKAGLLSGGQMQRLGIARALLRDPKILILDECTASLDRENKALIKNLITSLKESRDRIIIVITHQQDVADIADRVIRLSE